MNAQVNINEIYKTKKGKYVMNYSADGATKVSSPQQKRGHTAESNERETLDLYTRNRKCETIFGRFIKGSLLIV